MTPYHSDPWLTVWLGDCREVMAQMEPESVHCVVTSPPYWGLRDYGTATWLGGDEGCDHVATAMKPSHHSTLADHGADGRSPYLDNLAGIPYRHQCGKCGAVRQDSQLGLEPTPEEYVANMVAVFREVRRVLRADGTCWVNLGDSYAHTSAQPPTSGSTTLGRHGEVGRAGPYLDALGTMGAPAKRIDGLKPKDLVGIPWRVAFALQADGWYLRSDIIWAKPNPMPESVTDRPTKAHEYLFLLSKSARYYYDADAVREDIGRETRRAASFRDGGIYTSGRSFDNDGAKDKGTHGDGPVSLGGRNLRSVWSIATQPYPGAHFATFPEALVEPCVKAGTSERGVCPECGAPWRRVVERGDLVATEEARIEAWDRGKTQNTGGARAEALRAGGFVPNHYRPTETTGWQPSCSHDLPPVAATVLDPFAGSGTTGRVAQRLGRRALLIDLNAEYLTQAMKRNAAIPLGLEAG